MIQDTTAKSYGILVTNLCVADFLMGVYLLMIAIVDEYYRGTYITQDEKWRESIWCSAAGILSMVSSEASVLFIFLITLDRMLMVKFTFGEFRIRPSQAVRVSLCIWLFAFTIAILPLMFTDYFGDNFYGKSGVCVALPLTTELMPGWEYSISFFVGLNFILFLFIGAGQVFIYREIMTTRRQCANTRARNDEMKIARRLLLVAVSDFLCWVPIGCLCIMALSGVAISGDVYAWVIIFVLPINSALNPFLYTLMSKLC